MTEPQGTESPPLQAGSVSHTGTLRLDPRNCESIPLKMGFHYVQVPLKTGFKVYIFINLVIDPISSKHEKL